MAIDTDRPEGEAFLRLTRALHERRTGRIGGRRYSRSVSGQIKMRPPLELLHAYQHGDPPLNDVHNGWKDYVRQYVRMGRLNVAGLLVSSTSNRMQLRDFRTAAADDEMGDQLARSIMRANEWATGSGDVHDNMLGMADAYGLAAPPLKGEKYSLITAEDPREVITDDDPRTGRVRRGVKVFRDDWDSADIAYLYLPGGAIKRAIKKGRTTLTVGPFSMSSFRPDAIGWEWDDTYGDNGVATTPGNRMPLVHFRNQYGTGEFEEHMDALDRINDKIFNEWWTSKIQAFRQRGVINLPEKDEDTGEDIDYTDMFRASPDEMWQVPGDVEFWESTPVDLNPIVNSIQKDLERLAAVTSQPLHTITPDAANGSAEGASLMREEHLYKIGNRLARVDRKHAQLMSLGFAFMVDDPEAQKRADATLIDPMWGPIERFSLTEKSSAAAQLKGILPLEAIFTDVLQYAPADLPNLRALAGRDALFVPPPAPGRPAPTPAPAPAA